MKAVWARGAEKGNNKINFSEIDSRCMWLIEWIKTSDFLEMGVMEDK